MSDPRLSDALRRGPCSCPLHGPGSPPPHEPGCPWETATYAEWVAARDRVPTDAAVVIREDFKPDPVAAREIITKVRQMFSQPREIFRQCPDCKAYCDCVIGKAPLRHGEDK